MKEINILDDLYNKKITEKKAQQLFNKIIDKDTKEFLDPVNLIQMSTHEWFAIAYQDMSIATIAKWRHEGWPIKCVVCYKKCDINKACRPFHELKIKNKIKHDVMIHLNCLSKLPEEESRPKLYDEYVDSPFWPIVAKVFKDLEINQEIKIKKYPSDAIGYIVKQLEEAK